MIARRPYRMLCDFERAYQFLVDVYERDCRNGRHAPFLEYAQVYPDFDARRSHHIALWRMAMRSLRSRFMRCAWERRCLRCAPATRD